jgi:hypothetical protein
MFRSLALFSLISACLAPNAQSAQQSLPTPQPAENSPLALPPGVAVINGKLTATDMPKEDWTKLAADKSVLKPMTNGAKLAKAENPDFTRELVRLQWRVADPIDIYVVKPHGVQKPHVALYLYSYPSDVDRFRDDGWCRRVTSKGLAAVGFVSALTGERIRYRGLKDWFVPELQESLGSTVHDVQMILDYLAARGDLSVDEVGMWGEGSGASIAILAAAADSRIQALDLLDPWGDWPDWLKTSPVAAQDRAQYLTPQFLEQISMLDPVTWLPKLKIRALRLQQVLEDQDTPSPARDKLAAAVPHDRLVQYKDVAAHHEAWKETGLSGWLAAQLLPASKPEARSVAGNAKISPQ